MLERLTRPDPTEGPGTREPSGYRRDRLQKLANQLHKGKLAASGEHMKGDYTLEWLFEYLLEEKTGYFVRQQRQKENTLFDYRSQYRLHIKPRIGHIKLSKLSVSHVDSIPLRMLNDPEKPSSTRTAEKVLKLVQLCLKEAVRQGFASRNVAERAMRIEVKKFKATIIGVPDLVKLVEKFQKANAFSLLSYSLASAVFVSRRLRASCIRTST